MQVTIRAASKRYGGRQIFEGVDLDCASGSVVLLRGPSGSGKTTLLSVIAGWVKLDSGAVLIDRNDGSQPTGPDPALVAWIPQGTNALPSRTVLDNVMIGALSQGFDVDSAELRAELVLNEVGLLRLAEQRAATLSGGELQRLCFARAAASGIAIILADEPTANLDGANTASLTIYLQRLARISDSVVVVATHDDALTVAADRVVNMRGYGA